MKINGRYDYGILNVDLTCSFCCDFEFSCNWVRSGIWLLIKWKQIKLKSLLVVTHSTAPINLHLSRAQLLLVLFNLTLGVYSRLSLYLELLLV